MRRFGFSSWLLRKKSLEGGMVDDYIANGLEAFPALLLLLEELAFPRNIGCMELRQHVFAERLYGLPGNNL